MLFTYILILLLFFYLTTYCSVFTLYVLFCYRKSDSIPIIIKQPGSHSFTGSIEIASVPMVTTPLSGGGTRPRRFRTQSDSAVKEPMIPEDAVGDEMCMSDDTSPLTH